MKTSKVCTKKSLGKGGMKSTLGSEKMVQEIQKKPFKWFKQFEKLRKSAK